MNKLPEKITEDFNERMWGSPKLSHSLAMIAVEISKNTIAINSLISYLAEKEKEKS